MPERLETDFLVIGSGLAGLSFAIKVSKLGEVTIVTKKEIMESSTNYAQGGIATVISEEDSFECHIEDTMRVGCGLSDRNAVEALVKNGPKEILWLISLGVEFDKEKGKLSLSREGGHSRNRILHIGDHTGTTIENQLVLNVREQVLSVYENCIAIDLIVKDQICYGAKVFDVQKGQMINILSKVTALATGGIGQLYSHTSNPTIATGDGIAMAYRGGARIKDMEFIQFHPTTLKAAGASNFLISETVRGEGGKLVTKSGNRFMEKYHKLKELAPRDVVSRAVFEEQEKDPVFLDIRHKGRAFLEYRFPTIYKECKKYGIDIATDLIPVSPAAHYMCGGIQVGLDGETRIKRLFAFGECACTGVHGANRLASNSLLESVAFSPMAVKGAHKYLESRIMRDALGEAGDDKFIEEEDEIKKELQDLMWNKVGIKRSGRGLREALKTIKKLKERYRDRRCVELTNMLTLAKLIAQAGLIREESRGTHFRVEYPDQNDVKWLNHIIFEGSAVRIEPAT